MDAQHDADRYSSPLALSLACPNCGSSGLIPWDKLDRVLGCRGCAKLYRVEPHGLFEFERPDNEEVSVETRSGSSEWQKHSVTLYRTATIGERIVDFIVDLPSSWRGRIAIASLAVMLILGLRSLFAEESPFIPPADLPTALDERAILLAEAVAKRDTNMLIQLTEPSQHRALRIWVAHGKDVPKKVSTEATTLEPEVVSKPPAEKSRQATIKVVLKLPPDGKEWLITEHWIRRADTWYFTPVLVRSPPPPKLDPTQQNQKSRRG